MSAFFKYAHSPVSLIAKPSIGIPWGESNGSLRFGPGRLTIAPEPTAADVKRAFLSFAAGADATNIALWRRRPRLWRDSPRDGRPGERITRRRGSGRGHELSPRLVPRHGPPSGRRFPLRLRERRRGRRAMPRGWRHLEDARLDPGPERLKGHKGPVVFWIFNLATGQNTLGAVDGPEGQGFLSGLPRERLEGVVDVHEREPRLWLAGHGYPVYPNCIRCFPRGKTRIGAPLRFDLIDFCPTYLP